MRWQQAGCVPIARITQWAHNPTQTTDSGASRVGRAAGTVNRGFPRRPPLLDDHYCHQKTPTLTAGGYLAAAWIKVKEPPPYPERGTRKATPAAVTPLGPWPMDAQRVGRSMA
jgi:hypothetical protein